ncbi:MAG: hypothetical protein KDD58_09415 [Bdellovibrionales bacterium]|nr:hypothetical protein [Bdellovibrionales bacterium]
MKNLFFLLSIFINVACATSYRVSDIKEHALKENIYLEYTLSEINKDINDKKEIIDGLQKSEADFLLEPYASLQQDFLLMSELKEKLIEKQKKIQAFIVEFNNIDEDKDRLKKNDQEFAYVLDYKKLADKQKVEVENLLNEYGQSSQHFNSISQENQIYLIDTRALAQQTMILKNQIQSSIRTNKLKIDQLQKKIDKIKSSPNKKNRIISEMKGLLRQIESESLKIHRAGVNLKKTIKPSGRIVIGPNMKSHELVSNIKEYSRNIDILVKRFNNLNKKLKE